MPSRHGPPEAFEYLTAVFITRSEPHREDWGERRSHAARSTLRHRSATTATPASSRARSNSGFLRGGGGARGEARAERLPRFDRGSELLARARPQAHRMPDWSQTTGGRSAKMSSRWAGRSDGFRNTSKMSMGSRMALRSLTTGAFNMCVASG